MILLHHLNNSRSQRIVWLLEELQIPYEIKKYQRTMPDRKAPPELREVHILGKSPVITISEEGKDDIVLAESGAIIQYLIKEYGGDKLAAPASGEIDDIYFTHFAEGTLMPALVQKLKYLYFAEHWGPWYLRPLVRLILTRLINETVDAELETQGAYVEAHLSRDGREWFSGGSGPTAADFAMKRGLDWLITFDIAGPSTRACVERIHSRPAYKAAIAKVGE